MAYDAARGNVVLFGGYAPITRQTWIWNGTNWIQQHPATSPPGDVSFQMDFDPASRRIVMPDGNQTWTWDGVTWRREHPLRSPSPRQDMGVARDAKHVVLYGGQQCPDETCNYLGGTWSWTSLTWAYKHPKTKPPPIFGMGMAYDGFSRQIVMFGGGTYGQWLDTTWTWDGRNWTLEDPATQPDAREGVRLAYDSSRRQVVLFGGYQGGIPGQFWGDTWTWDGSTWTEH